MPATTQITIASFDELQNQIFDASKKYLPVGVAILEQHIYGSQIEGLLLTINPNFNRENIFNLQVAGGFPVAVYGFTIALNKEGIPSLLFGNIENQPNEFPIQINKDEDGDVTIKVGKAWLEFEQNITTKAIEAYVGYKRLRVKARALLVENINFIQLEKANTIEKFAACLSSLPSGGSYAFKLKGLSHPSVVEQKEVKFPLMLNIDSIDEVYQGDSFLSRNLNISGIDGAKIWGTNKDGNIEEVTKVTIYNSMTAGIICEEIGAARFLLCKLFGGIARLVIVAANSNPDYNPKHVLQLLAPENPVFAEGYKKAKSELSKAISEGASYTHILTPEAVKKFTNNSVNNQPQIAASTIKQEMVSTATVAEILPF